MARPGRRRPLRHAAARLADLDRSAAAAGAPASLGRFLVELTLDPPSSTGDLAGPPQLDDDYLTHRTIHSAKGGEWDVVHVLHLADGNLPSDLATGDAEQIEEERRLLYVAMTRARDELHVLRPAALPPPPTAARDDAHGYAQRSRFLTPAVLEHVDHQGAAPVPEPEPDADVDRGGPGADRWLGSGRPAFGVAVRVRGCSRGERGCLDDAEEPDDAP